MFYFKKIFFLFCVTLSFSFSIQNLQEECCFIGKKHAIIHQDFHHFINLNQHNLNKRFENDFENTKLKKLFSIFNLSRHFYTNSSICEKNSKSYVNLKLPDRSDICQNEFESCCLNEQQKIAIGIDLALKTRFKKNKKNDILSLLDYKNDDKYEYILTNGTFIRTVCNRLKLDNLLKESLRIGQNLAFDSCEACSFGLDAMDQLQNCNNNNDDSNDSDQMKQNQLWLNINKQCCRVAYLSKIAENQGLIKIFH